MESFFWGYIFTAVNYVFYCVSRFQRDKKDILFLNLFAKFFTIIGLYCLDSLTGAGVMCLSFVACILTYLKEKYDWQLTVFYWILLMLSVLIFVNTFAGISSVLVFVTLVMNLTANWWFSPQQMRFTASVGSVLYLAYQISIANWAGLLEIFSFISNTVSYLKYRRS